MSAWEQSAACVGQDPALWWPETSDPREAEAGLAVCAECPVRLACLAEAHLEPWGIWGGTTPAQRGYGGDGLPFRIRRRCAECGSGTWRQDEKCRRCAIRIERHQRLGRAELERRTQVKVGA